MSGFDSVLFTISTQTKGAFIIEPGLHCYVNPSGLSKESFLSCETRSNGTVLSLMRRLALMHAPNHGRSQDFFSGGEHFFKIFSKNS